MKNKIIVISIITAITIGFITQSCVKDSFDFDKLSTDMVFNPNIAVPLINSKLTLRDLVRDWDDNELFEEDSTGFLYLMYSKHIFSKTAKDVVKIPTQSFTNSYIAPTNIDLNSVTYTYTDNTIEDFSVNNSSRLETIIIKSALLSINITSSQNLNGTVELEFPSIKKNGTSYTKIINLSTGGDTTYNDLNEYTIDLTTDNPAYNKLPVNYNINLTNSNASFNTGDEMFAATISLNNIEYKTIIGFIGQDIISIPSDSVHLDIFDKAFDGDIFFMDPKFKIFINNSFGIPMQFEFDSFKLYNAVNETYANYQFPIAHNPLTIDYPTLSNIGTSRATNFVMDTLSFPAIRDIISYNPKFIIFGVDGKINPTDPGTNDNFVLDTSKFDVNLKIELPIWGRAKYFVLQDTFDLDMSNFYQDIDSLEWMLFRINADNAMPLEVGIQIYFVDQEFSIIDSLYDNGQMNILESGVIDGSGKVVQPTNKISDFKFSSERLSGLHDVRYIFTRGYINTTDEATKLVRFYEGNYVSFKMGVQAQAFIIR